MPEYEGKEYDRVYGPYVRKISGAVRYQVSLRYGSEHVTSFYHLDKESADERKRYYEELLVGVVKKPRKKNTKRRFRSKKKAEAVLPQQPPSAQRPATVEEVDLGKELDTLAYQLQAAQTAEAVDLIKRKADAIKVLLAQQKQAKADRGEDPAAQMTTEELLEVCRWHLEQNGYKVTHAELRETPGEEGDQVHQEDGGPSGGGS